MRCHVKRQLTVALENQPGTLAQIARGIAQARVNIDAISILDNVEQGMVRLVASDPKRCKDVLTDQGFYVMEAEILVIEMPNHEGMLARVSAALGEAGINIDYAYGTVDYLGGDESTRNHPMRICMKVSEAHRACGLLLGLEAG